MLQEEIELLEKLEELKKFRAQSGVSFEFPTVLLTNIMDNISEVRRKVCFTNVQPELTKYCNNLKKVGTSAKKLIEEFNGTMESLSLELTMVEEVPGIISSNISDFLNERSTEIVLLRLKNIEENERNMR